METRRSGRPRKSEADSASVAKTPAKKSEASTSGPATRSRMSAKPKPLSTNVLIGIAMTTATVFMAVTVLAYQRYHSQYFTIPRFNNLMDRLTFTLQWNAITTLPLLLAMFNVMNGRLCTGAVDPLSGQEDGVAKAKNILTNTVEQTVFNFINQLVLISWIPTDQMYLVPLFPILFVLGRLAFMVGYTLSPRYRSFGFALTFGPTVFMFASNLLFTFGLRSQLPFFGTRSAVPASKTN